jgi:hypothetical protein
MNVNTAMTQGLRRAWRAPALLIGLWLLNVVVALPAAVVLSHTMEQSIGTSLFHQTLRDGFDADWYAEFSIEEDGLADTFRPSLLGAGPIYDNLDAWWSGRIFTSFPPLLWIGGAYVLLWLFLLGGVLNAFAAPEGPRYREGFAAACGRNFGRFLQLALCSGLIYYWIFLLSGWLFEQLAEASRQVTEERTIFYATLAIATLIVLLLHLVRMVFDYAKIAVAVDGASAPRAILRALRFVGRYPGRTLGVYAGLGGLAAVAFVLYALIAPGAGQSTFLTIAFAFALSQVYLVLRLGLRLSLLASEVALFRAEHG